VVTFCTYIQVFFLGGLHIHCNACRYLPTLDDISCRSNLHSRLPVPIRVKTAASRLVFRVCSCAFARVDLVSAPCRWHGQEVTGARGAPMNLGIVQQEWAGGLIILKGFDRSLVRCCLSAQSFELCHPNFAVKIFLTVETRTLVLNPLLYVCLSATLSGCLQRRLFVVMSSACLRCCLRSTSSVWPPSVSDMPRNRFRVLSVPCGPSVLRGVDLVSANLESWFFVVFVRVLRYCHCEERV
jgi:hypothetical protein